jgi:hypothetical protein
MTVDAGGMDADQEFVIGRRGHGALAGRQNLGATRGGDYHDGLFGLHQFTPARPALRA